MSTPEDPAGPASTGPPYFVGTPLSTIFEGDKIAKRMGEMTVKEMTQELHGLGVKDTSSAALKKDLATLLVIAHLPDAEAKAIHEYIDKLIPAEPSNSTGAKPLLSSAYNRLFNPVDRMNRIVYELYNRHPVVNWKFRILLYFTGVAFINLWSWLGNCITSASAAVPATRCCCSQGLCF